MVKTARGFSMVGLLGLLALLAGLWAAAPGQVYAGALRQQETGTPPTPTATLRQAKATLKGADATLKGADATATLQPTITITPSPTPLPAAYLETGFQTTGLILGASLLVIVIVGGTLLSIRRRR